MSEPSIRQTPPIRPTGSALRRAAALALVAACLAGCSAGPSQSTAATPAPTGITANNGGGVRSLNNQPNIGITTRTSP